ncbi:hypothetical protein KIPE111705_10990 [Kibdelosporangium persicum]|uniref:Uncharacterized protein n=1 Tax=Kibdelosporangium persicum TaxID=2698649 RepID=A0ABX2EX86_9PSEU|nr:hypothetical protein [Kibdelosporangium persicum]NRN63376.1 hypothetical protein [Kibdelosporangium persicum]
MNKFEEQLLDDLMRDHGPRLAVARRPGPRPEKPTWIATGVVALAGVTVGAVLLVPSDSPAYAVTDNKDGTVTVSVDNASAVDDVDKQLRGPVRVSAGVPVHCDPSGVVRLLPQRESLEAALSEVVGAEVPTRIRMRKNDDGSFTLTGVECGKK